MRNIRNFAEAHEALREFYGSSTTGPYTLDRMRTLMEFLGNPQEQLRVVHVAGTSGKTSTSYYASAFLEAGGYKIGLTVSPHVDEVNERVQVNREPLPEQAFCRALSEFLNLVDASGIRPSYFEFMIAFAYWHFAREQVDYAVIEVGLGGLMDATNVITRADKVCIITDIGLDHTEILGETLGEIAAQKAGIIRSGNHVFMYEQGSEVMAPVRERCQRQHANLHLINSIDEAFPETVDLPLFQRRNSYLALQAATFVRVRDDRPELSEAQLRAAIAIRIPARMERFAVNGKTVVVDGSHNGQKIGALVASMQTVFSGQHVAALVAFADGDAKRWQRGIDALKDIADDIIITAFYSEKDVPKHAVNPQMVADYCRAQGFASVAVEADPRTALEVLLQRSESILLVVGSFYLLNHIRPLLAHMS